MLQLFKTSYLVFYQHEETQVRGRLLIVAMKRIRYHSHSFLYGVTDMHGSNMMHLDLFASERGRV